MSEQISPAGALAVFELTGDELRQMIKLHVKSARACAAEISFALAGLPADHDADVPEEKRRGAVFKASIDMLMVAIREADYLALHIPDRKFMLTATQILAFQRRWGKIEVDVAKLAWAPSAGTNGSEQAERSLASTITATPRIVLPDGSMKQFR